MFLTPLRIEKVGPQSWILIDDLVYESKLIGVKVEAIRGFQTDFASIPRAVGFIFPKVDKYDAAAVIHDAAYAGTLYEHHEFSYPYPYPILKEWADKLFYEAMRASGVNVVKAKIMYWAVSMFGDPSGHPKRRK